MLVPYLVFYIIIVLKMAVGIWIVLDALSSMT